MRAQSITLLVLAFLVAISSAASFRRCPWRQSRHFTLEFKYGAREGYSLSSSSFSVKWNGRIIRNITPKDFKIHKVKLALVAKAGSNTIHFIGKGKSDSTGATIDDVYMYRPGP